MKINHAAASLFFTATSLGSFLSLSLFSFLYFFFFFSFLIFYLHSLIFKNLFKFGSCAAFNLHVIKQQMLGNE